jgi:ligand-binding sensor domain-containing protein/signal transduction histidine kinase
LTRIQVKYGLGLFMKGLIKSLSSILLIPTLHLLLCSYTLGLDPQKSLEQYAYDMWTTKNGLLQSSIHGIVQTKNGYIWLSGASGLARFDGVRFTIYDYTNTPEINSSGVGSIRVGQDGNLLFLSNNSIWRFKDNRILPYFKDQERFKDLNITAFYEDTNGTLWIGTKDRGLFVLKDDSTLLYTTKEGLANNYVLTIFEDKEGSFWIGTESGVAKIKGKEVVTYNRKNSLVKSGVTSICQDQEGRMWFGTRTGLVSLEDGKFTLYNKEPDLTLIRVVIQDKDGNIWIGSRFSGLVRFKDGRFLSANTCSMLDETDVQVIYEDREGNLWVATRRGVLIKISDGQFTIYTSKEGLSGDDIKGLYENKDGSIWIGAEDGLNLLKDGKLTSYIYKDGSYKNTVKAVYKDRKDNLWIGSARGIVLFKDGKFTPFLGDTKGVVSISEDLEGSLWLGSPSSGLSRFKDGEFKSYSIKDGLPSDEVRVVYVDSKGAIWVGTHKGLVLFKDGKIMDRVGNMRLPRDSIRSLYEDSRGNLWIGTHSNGLIRIRDEEIVEYNPSNHPLNHGVYQIREDADSNLWVGGRREIIRISRSELDAYPQRGTNTLSVLTYNLSDSMQNVECSINTHYAADSSNKSKGLMFATIGGLLVIDPEKITSNQLVPSVLIEEILLDNQPINTQASNLKIPPSSGDIEIHYTGFNFATPERLRFKYILEGYDENWIDAGARRTAYYTNLRSGNYRFRVIASSRDGIWNEEGASFNLYLQPHFYETYWFYMAAILLIALMGWSINLLRTRVMLRQTEAKFQSVLNERNRIAIELHDTLLQGLSGIAWQIDSIKLSQIDLSSELTKKLNLIRELVRYNQEEARRSILNLRTQRLEEAELGTALVNYAKQLTKETSINICTQIKESDKELDTEIEHHLLRIGQEAIGNAVKHAKAGNIVIELICDSKSISLSVKDDGCGFDLKSLSLTDTRFGLAGIHERVAKLRGEIFLDSSPQNGTSLTVIVPTNKVSTIDL